MKNKNFLLGKGELLSRSVHVPSGGGDKKPPYSFTQSKKRVHRKLISLNEHFANIPEEACPKNEVIALVTMHPRYISKSDFPEELFKSVGLRSIGSRPTKITPEAWGTTTHPVGDVITEQVFVAGTKKSFSQWTDQIENWKDSEKTALQITKIEDIFDYPTHEKTKLIPIFNDEIMLEVVLHNAGDKAIIEAFEAYAQKTNNHPLMDRMRDVNGLSFIPVMANHSTALNLALFSFLRVMRPMPRLRPINSPILRSHRAMPVILPLENALNPNLNVVVFDGGFPDSIGLNKWVTSIDPPKIGPPNPVALAHGIGVTSALLFGHIEQPFLEQPFCNVDHVRVLDKSLSPDLELLDILDRILNHLDHYPKKYDFVNISLGPNLAINDDEVTLWTASIDERLSRQDALVTVAVGNEGDALEGMNRIQPPSDGVNILSVGACDSLGVKWTRASYSCVGPGRRPGIVKPDGLAFGGSEESPFIVLAPSSNHQTRADCGTSFASPLALRSAIGVKAYLGENISQRTIRALLIHKANDNGHSKLHVGWGRFETDVEALITCDDNEALVIYQGELPVSSHLRADLPIPIELTGLINITATLLIASEIDPQHPGAYTRNGLEVAFRPHAEKFKSSNEGKISKHPKTTSFFSAKNLYKNDEYDLREDGHKWEPCLKMTKKFRSTSLSNPCFDIYYHYREKATKGKYNKPIPYSLIVSIKAQNMPDFYNQVVRTYANILIPLRPQIQIPIHV